MRYLKSLKIADLSRLWVLTRLLGSLEVAYVVAKVGYDCTSGLWLLIA